MPLTDEKTLQAIRIGEPAVAGWLYGIVVYDVTEGVDFIYSEKSERDPFPIDLPYGHVVSISGSAENTGDIEQNMICTLELIDPDGIVRGTVSKSSKVSPGVVFSTSRMDDIMPDKYGMWLIHGVLEAEPA